MKLCRLVLLLSVVGIGAALALLAVRSPLLALIALLLLGAKNRKRLNLFAYGTARLSTAEELLHAGCLADGPGLGVVVIGSEKPSLGRSLRCLFRFRVPAREAVTRFVFAVRGLPRLRTPTRVQLNSSVHYSVFAPTGAGKGVSLVIPHLLRCPDSMVVLDFKGENAKLTADHRRTAFGHRCVVLDPFNVVGGTDTLNVFDTLPHGTPLVLDDLRAQAEGLIASAEQQSERHWDDSARAEYVGMAAVTALYAEPKDRHIQTVAALLADPARRVAAIKVMLQSDAWSGMLQRIGAHLSTFEGKELSSIRSTLSRHLAFLNTVPVALNTRASTFDPADLCRGKLTVYLVLPPDQMRAQAALLRLWVGTLLRACVQGGLNETVKKHYVLDEAASLGPLPVLESALDKYRAYGVRIQLYYQSLGQLKVCWRDGLDQSVLSNTSQVYFAPSDWATAEQLSNRLGEFTQVVASEGDSRGSSDSRSTTDGTGNVGGNRGTSRNFTQMGRKLARPEELLAWPKSRCLSLVPGMHPIVTTLVPYFAAPQKPPRWRATRLAAEAWLTAVLLLSTALALGHTALAQSVWVYRSVSDEVECPAST